MPTQPANEPGARTAAVLHSCTSSLSDVPSRNSASKHTLEMESPNSYERLLWRPQGMKRLRCKGRSEQRKCVQHEAVLHLRVAERLQGSREG